jgi:hypothetical protein
LARHAQGEEWGGDAGFDVRYNIRPESVFTATAHPDFAIIEADEEFINLTRFEPALVGLPDDRRTLAPRQLS